ncbi:MULTISPECIES: ornithine--oxo-acid transaminase [unclassified Mycolicibacterium]|uniref:ornithine--oxo-acid transaminase n=1 Tax=unclassified Mycolicibacterium TaxID=2636767 RepID=UPI0012DD5960|nr:MULTISPECIES: ornithine--oxo-acid transaminase [unclassified Mycolicibacterium]MUL81471.1 ornithine--oxo-acid transaminase [Mycolicibacterium sp. CBMA 329]MUL87237.1 ornithine--oxo-acid transaminase [Mycolicibacterium sp. CBMA 331]MUL98481.1 ornithine--oxo-acid transaminase [Mycolicibacterium sp. CBMA 334]MUM25237.1 ornithine--oxo-acid transaminase [Mycolicibacterium sp. CBMA 295]MUM37534.1 ornithine--oxo-acid transaminase [Mycolicibacterium sp. CBMA 247]
MTMLDSVDNQATPDTATAAAIALDDRYVAHNYSPLPVVAASADGAWITDVTGRRYLDCLAAYSAVNFGHRNPEIIAAAHAQLDRLTLVSRAFHSDRLGPFAEALAELCGKDMVLPMNSGAEAVESGIKVARKWSADVKGVTPGEANIVVAHNNFHGRTTTIISFSDDESARRGFGPYTPGFRSVPFGDHRATEDAIDANTAAVLIEPIQGEAGVIVPPADFLPRVREICTRNNVLMIADEIQSGLARTGRTFACEHWGVVPDVYLLGKALGGGVVPLSTVVADRDVLGVLHPGEHGSTFGGNPLASAIGTTVVRMLSRGEFQLRSSELGTHLHERLTGLIGHGVTAVRGIGLWAGVDIDPDLGTGKQLGLALAERGVLVKDTNGSTLRFAPPLVVTADELDWAVDQFADALAEARR